MWRLSLTIDPAPPSSASLKFLGAWPVRRAALVSAIRCNAVLTAARELLIGRESHNLGDAAVSRSEVASIQETKLTDDRLDERHRNDVLRGEGEAAGAACMTDSPMSTIERC
jgi:hypothetical protein